MLICNDLLLIAKVRTHKHLQLMTSLSLYPSFIQSEAHFRSTVSCLLCKVKLEAVRRSLLDKLAVANCKFETLKEMAATMSPTDNEEKKGHTHTLKQGRARSVGISLLVSFNSFAFILALHWHL